MSASTVRSRPDRCPGVLRPWPADDGALVRIRLIGGRISAAALSGLSAVAQEYGDGHLHLTARGNLQLRALPWSDGVLPVDVVAAIEATGLLPSRAHELGRNVMVSPLTGITGGRADLRDMALELDNRIRASTALAGLPGRFLFVLDDGRGDLLDRETDLGLVALAETSCQLRIGDDWGPVVPLTEVPAALVDLAEEFLSRRGDAAGAPWHVRELPEPLRQAGPVDPAVPTAAPPLPFGRFPGGEHLEVPGGVLTPGLVGELTARAADLVVTPWRGVVVAA
ncbi:MAG: nitrite reductase [Propionibacteriales bacterium]|nr:nitrite reductase [Propionibacteriales bacterium]